MTPADNPAAIYRDSLSRGSYWAVHHSPTRSSGGVPVTVVVRSGRPSYSIGYTVQ